MFLTKTCLTLLSGSLELKCLNLEIIGRSEKLMMCCFDFCVEIDTNILNCHSYKLFPKVICWPNFMLKLTHASFWLHGYQAFPKATLCEEANLCKASCSLWFL